MLGIFKKYKQQKCKCLSILKGTKTNCFNNLNPKVIADNKKLWSAVKPFFSKKSKAMNTTKWYVHFRGKSLPKENLKQFAFDVLKPLMRKSLMIN